jgi:peptidoglycan/xylan/chitin deacetylase (PgdA/CDA1 family)
MKRPVLNLLRRAGTFALFRRANRDKALVLTYHRFSHEQSARAVSARDFAEHVRYLTRHYRVVPLSELASRLASGAALPQGLAVITIDDCYGDAYEVAFPVLRRYNAPATLFVVTDFVDRKGWLWTDKLRFVTTHSRADNLEAKISGQTLRSKLNGFDSRIEAAARMNSLLKALPDGAKEEAITRIASSLGVELPALPADDYRPVTWEQAREMDRGGVEIGSHTKTHPILTRVDDRRLAAELRQSRERLEAALGRPVDLFCYPNGDEDERVRRAAEGAGYRCAVTVEPGFNGRGVDPLRLRRMDAEANFMRFIQVTSGFDQLKNSFRRARASRAGMAAGL